MRGLREARLREAAEKAGFEKQFREAASFEKRPARLSPGGGTGRWNGLSQRQEIEGEFDYLNAGGAAAGPALVDPRRPEKHYVKVEIPRVPPGRAAKPETAAIRFQVSVFTGCRRRISTAARKSRHRRRSTEGVSD